jgi:2'-5' RNA ligase
MQNQLRTFVAIDIPNELKKNISTLKNELNIEGIKLVEDENLHITLKFLGDVESTKLANIEQALRAVKFKKFVIKLRGIGVFPNERYVRVVWIGCESHELEGLAENINDALSSYFKQEPFSAHLTIARVKRKIDLSSFLDKHKADEFGEFEVNSFELKSSELRREGPIYTTLAVFQAID